MPKFQHHAEGTPAIPGGRTPRINHICLWSLGVWEFGEFGTKYLGARWATWAVDNLLISIMEFGEFGSLRVTILVL